MCADLLAVRKKYFEDKSLYSLFRNVISEMIFDPIYMPRALNTGTCIQQGDLFYSAGQHRKKIGRGFGKNAGEWTGRVEISKEELPGSKRSMYGYILTYSRLERENV